ncbi:hypothetical protein FOXB_12877 [Fusarium oxysporum f. sp. conglutinans Fo5176]|uniref:receptor protein-tyrosine kinase n=1 Tax=Fusarium oxysporum (strain Fo5176) TaxID=660025 RepID=F9G2L1_FUSOF|nr:hypothetical protein FOXB_12877 [Fusarium oxysporum f. sp. conglutinans Fo5176]
MEDAALDLQLSRIISAVEQTTIFTTIVPKPTAQSEVTQESNSDNGSSGLPGTKIFGALEIIIALGVLAGVLLLIMSIILCDRRRKSKRKRAAERAQNRMTDKSEPLEGHQQPSGARLPESIWPRMADKNQAVHDYWHSETLRQKQGWNQGQQAGVQQGLPRYG